MEQSRLVFFSSSLLRLSKLRMRAVQVNLRLGRHPGSLKLLHQVMLLGIHTKLMRLPIFRICYRHCSSLFFLSHKLPLKSFFFKLIITLFLFNLGGIGLFLPSFKSEAQEGVKYTTCNNGYAVKLKADEPHPGRYLPCENYDKYFELNEAGRKAESERLLVK